MSLAAAHKGYSYQDLLSAYLILQAFRKFKEFEFLADFKESKDDSFDDLIIITPKTKYKYQIRKTSTELTKRMFEGKGRFSLSNFSKSYSKNKIPTKYILAITRGVDNKEKIYKELPSDHLFISRAYSLNPSDFPSIDSSFLSEFVLNPYSPDMSGDIQNPGELERLIFNFLNSEIGIGDFPNESLSVESFTLAIQEMFRAIRSGDIKQPVSRTSFINLLSSRGLVVDYGQIAQQFPLISSQKRLHFKDLQNNLKKGCFEYRNVILVGSPGSGKSHQFDDLYKGLNKEKDVVAIKHYCYLEPTDDLILERINVNRMFGNLVSQLVNAFPNINDDLSRIFAADRIRIEEMVKIISEKEKKKVVIMIDGLDHLERIVDQNGDLSPNVVNRFIEELLKITLPKNCSLLISSQPGDHLNKFTERKDLVIINVPSWEEKDIKNYLLKEGIPSGHLDNKKNNSTFISKVFEVSEGNPLYLSYLVKEIKNRQEEYWSIIRDLPKLCSNIDKYYEHLTHSIASSDLSIVETIALLDFSVEKEKLLEMFPAIDRQRVEKVLKDLSPVLKENYSLAGIRIYHESFRRYILKQPTRTTKVPKKDLYSHIINWLEKQGFFESTISYNYLFAYLKRGEQQEKILELVDTDFLDKSLYNLQTVDSMSRNIAIAADVASQKQDWGCTAKLAQLNRALYTFSEERGNLFDEAADAFYKIFGAKKFVEKMTLNGNRTLSLSKGIRYCHKVALQKINAPWAEYNPKNLSLPVGNDGQKLLYFEIEASLFYKSILGKTLEESLTILFDRLSHKKDLTNQARINFLIDQLFILFETEKIIEEILKIKHIDYGILISIASHLSEENKIHIIKPLKGLKEVLRIRDLLNLKRAGIDISDLADKEKLIAQFKENFKFVYQTDNIFDEQVNKFEEWYWLLEIIAVLEPSVINDIKKSIIRDGWYRAWLVYLTDLALAEVNKAQENKEKFIISALKELTRYKNPFIGKPRACDLYNIHHITKESFRRAIKEMQTNDSTKELIVLLNEVSRESTTTLQRSPGGPLTEDMLSDILLNEIENKSNEVQKTLKRGIVDQYKLTQDYGRFYDIQASEGFKAAIALSTLKEYKNAEKSFYDACHYSFGYGFRKDITLWEVIDTIALFYPKDKKFSLEAFSKTYLLPIIVVIHTDGAETKWSLSYWYKNLFEANLNLGIRFLTEDIKTNYKERDWRIEYISEDLANMLVGKINPKIVASLYKSLNMDDFDRTDFDPRLKLLEDFYVNKEDPEDYIADLAISLISWRYTFTDKKPYIRTLENFILMQKKYKFALPDWIQKKLESVIAEQADKKEDIIRSKILDEREITKLNLSMTVDEVEALIEKTRGDDLYLEENLKTFTEIVLNLAGSEDEIHTYSLLKKYARRSFVSGALKAFEVIGDKFLEKGYKNLALKAYTLGYFYSRSDKGWYIMGEEDSFPMVQKAVAISKNDFLKMLSEEIAQSIESPAYFTGGNQQLMKLFLKCLDDLSIAKSIWEETFNVISYRLPSFPIKEHKIPFNFEHPVRTDNLENETLSLIKQREAISDHV